MKATAIAPTPDNHQDRTRTSIAVVVKGYPRLSETFIAQELKALEDLQLHLLIFSLRRPTDATIHPIHREIHATVVYLPEYVYQEPVRVLRALWHAVTRLRPRLAALAWLRDLRRDPTPNRIRRFAQALVMARECPHEYGAIYAHFMHTPGSVARYAAMLLNRPWALSAHAKDIWTLPEWEKREKLAECTFLVTCTTANAEHLKGLAEDPQRVRRLYHGIDFNRFPDPGIRPRPGDGSSTHPAVLLSVGRAVPKKGYPVLLEALAALPADVCWRFIHIGGGPELEHLRELAVKLRIADRIEWRGAQSQQRVLSAYRESDLFVLASTITADGDRDGLPNVLMEAQSQRLCCLATRISGIPEIIEDGRTGILVEQNDVASLSRAMEQAIRAPGFRSELAERALSRLRNEFSQEREIAMLRDLLVKM